MSEKFIMVSLEDEKAKQLAEIISNKTSRKILDYLSSIEEASETDIAKYLHLPLNTIHYNIKNMLKANLIECKEFKWSEKGREINLYKIAKKYIIISPKSDNSMKEKLKNIFISLGLTTIISFLIKMYFSPSQAVSQTEEFTQSAKMAFDVAQEQIVQPAQQIIGLTNNIYIWFLLGAVFAILVYNILLWRKEVK